MIPISIGRLSWSGLAPARRGSGAAEPARLRSVGLALLVAAFAVGLTPRATDSATAWHFDIYDPTAVRYQDPDNTACVATSTQMMLNVVYGQGEKDFELRPFSLLDRYVPKAGPAFVWKPSITYATQEAILAFDRANMTMLTSSAGTDPHGWRNGLNYFGWGTMSAGFYTDMSFTSFDAAAKAVVHAVAMYRKPVGILGWYGGHAQLVTGYSVTGADPQTGSMAFSVSGIYLTDPLRSQAMRDKYLGYSTWRYSVARIAFKQYWQKDSPQVDPIDGKAGTSEWYGRWVAIVPVR
jgi:hypothetical protein